MQFDLRLPENVTFGWGRRRELGRLAAARAARAWLISGSRTLERTGGIDDLTRQVEAAGVKVLRLPTLTHEPEVGDVDRIVDEIRSDLEESDCVIAVGGGAALDLGKAAAGLAPQTAGGVRDYLEGVGRGLQIERAPLPMIAVPTTAGTGTEATKNAVISSYDPPFKKSLRDNRLVPGTVLIDPELTVSNPRTVTAYSGMDAVTQLIESFVTPKANPFTRALSKAGLRMAVPALPVAVDEPANREAREAMSYAAWLSGITLANAGLGFAHGVAPALGVHCRVPHGLACAVLLPTAMQVNRDQCRVEYAELGELMTGRRFETVDEAADAALDVIASLASRIGIPRRLRDVGVERSQIASLVPSSRGNSMSGNPRQLSDAELLDVLEQLW